MGVLDRRYGLYFIYLLDSILYFYQKNIKTLFYFIYKI